MSGPQPVCNCQCEEKSSPFSRGRVRQCGVRQREQSPPTMHVSCVHSVSRQISAVYCEADQPPPPTTWVHLHATHFQNLAFSLFLQNNMSAFSALEDMYVCSMFIIVHPANTNISRIFSLGMRQNLHAQIFRRSPACNIVRHLRIVRDIRTFIII